MNKILRLPRTIRPARSSLPWRTASVVKWVAVVLIIVGALNWGLVGAFHYNLVATLFGDFSVVTRVIYILVGLAGVYKIFLMVGKR